MKSLHQPFQQWTVRLAISPAPRLAFRSAFLTAPRMALVLGLGSSLLAHAGRPLSVEDAGINGVGEGHVETWWSRARGESPTLTVSPAYAPLPYLELAAAYSRALQTGQEAHSFQAKFLITPAAENACNGAAAAGASREALMPAKAFVTGIVSCNHAVLGRFHSNLGAKDVSRSQRVTTWGLAWERDIGPITVHTEVYGEQHNQPVWAAGARHQISTHWQLDGSIGRQAQQNWVTLGAKWLFN